jgi:flagellum-specific peptidoglycan hydrolase FlgJ
MVAAEAALESEWGRSLLALQDNNLFGVKAHEHPDYGIAKLPTREFEGGTWIEVAAASWEKYPDWASCFADRLATLRRLAPHYPHYSAALLAPDAGTYIREVSQTWSTDPAYQCACGQAFLTAQEVNAHEPSHGTTPWAIKRVPGLGRALKVLAIYKEYLQ